MRTIWRYPVEITDEQTITMPAGAEILHVARRDGAVTASRGVTHDAVELWALVDPTADREPRHIRVIGTGNPIGADETLVHLGSVQIEHGRLVFHVFEDPA